MTNDLQLTTYDCSSLYYITSSLSIGEGPRVRPYFDVVDKGSLPFTPFTL